MNPLYVMNQARQMMASMNPQQIISRMMPDVPAEIRNDPNRIIDWMRQTGRISDEQIRQAQQMMGRR